ncbi:MAG: Ku protein [Polyangiaceae bacterium]|jgi:DNA end-binding protein Ku|nr:Ku protein [Polyangiaceae bacterium]
MARAIWTGTVGFGLVQIPVGLHTAEDRAELDMTLLDKRNLSPVGYERVNKKTGKEVTWENIVKGYEHKEGEYVVLTDQDFAEANVEATKQIDILDFVNFADIDPRYVERPYYLAPQKAGKKSYALLREVLRRTGKAGIGKVVIRTRQHLAAVVAHDSALLLVLLRFADELRDDKGLDLPSTNLKTLGITPKEVAMAEKLVEGMVTDFEPEKYEDDYHRDLMKLIHRKVKAGEVNTLPTETKRKRTPAPAAKQVDLSELLAQSVSAAKKPKAANENHKRAGRKARTETQHRKSA